jgi:plasmid stabilization system protein ParE
MRQLSFNRLAEHELAEAAEYYERESPGLGERFLEEVRSSSHLLQRYPYAAPKVSGSTRRLVLPRFPYCLFYRVFEDRIRILAVAHQKRHPRYWVGRT